MLKKNIILNTGRYFAYLQKSQNLSIFNRIGAPSVPHENLRPASRFVLLLILAVSTFNIYCGKNSNADICDPESGKFVHGTHYISSRFLNEDKTWNYTAWQTYNDRKSSFNPESSCIPLEYTESLTEKIRNLEIVTDIQR